MGTISEVIATKLKEQYNMAYAFIEKKEYERARDCFIGAEELSRIVQYHEGIVMANMSLANLYLLVGDFISSFDYAVVADQICKEKEIQSQMNPMQMVHSLTKPLLKQGMQLEKEKELEKAYGIYERILPFLPEKQQVAVKQEMSLIKKYLEKKTGITRNV